MYSHTCTSTLSKGAPGDAEQRRDGGERDGAVGPHGEVELDSMVRKRRERREERWKCHFVRLVMCIVVHGAISTTPALKGVEVYVVCVSEKAYLSNV